MIMNEIEAKKKLEKAHKNFIASNFSLARKQWFEILDFFPNNVSVLKGISLTYYNEKNLLGTEEILKKIIKINLSEPNALTMLILVLEDQDKILEAK